MRREGARSVAAIIVVENTPNRRPPSIITLQEEDTQIDRKKDANEAGPVRKA